MLKRELDLETKLIPGGVGEFTIWINGTKVAEKDYNGFPSEAEVLESAKSAI